jgi:hypothetical protein
MGPNVFPEDLYDIDERRCGQMEGLTKRELFAAMAMQGYLSNPGTDGDLTEIAEDAVDAADALIKGLKA